MNLLQLCFPQFLKLLRKLFTLKKKHLWIDKKLTSLLCRFRKKQSTRSAIFNFFPYPNSGYGKFNINKSMIPYPMTFFYLNLKLMVLSLIVYNLFKIIFFFRKRVKRGCCFRQCVEILLRVPQRSILDPILFNILIFLCLKVLYL